MHGTGSTQREPPVLPFRDIAVEGPLKKQPFQQAFSKRHLKQWDILINPIPRRE